MVLGSKLKPIWETFKPPATTPATPTLPQWEQDLNSSLENMRKAFTTNLATERQNALRGVGDVYASRGITGSGEEAFALGQTGTNFGNQAAQFESQLGLQSLQMRPQLQQAYQQQQEQSQFADLAQKYGMTPTEFQIGMTNPDFLKELQSRNTMEQTGQPQQFLSIEDRSKVKGMVDFAKSGNTWMQQIAQNWLKERGLSW